MELNPQQEAFLQAYLDPQSDTFANCTQSGLKAGFTEEYSRNLLSLMPKWLNDNLQDSGLIAKSLANLSTFIDSDSDDTVDKRIKWEATKFTLERLNKKFKQKTENDGKLVVEVQPISGMKIIQDNDITIQE